MRPIPPAHQARRRLPTPAAKEDSGERLSKRVMQVRGCSRNEAEQYIAGGWVRVDGMVAEEPQRRVDQQKVTVDEHANLMAVTDITLILHKPAGYTDGLEDPEDDDEDEAPTRRPAQRGRKAPLPNARSLLTAAAHWANDTSGTRVLKRHLQHLDADVELENGASGLVVFTQDWRTTRKLTEDMGVMEHEMLVEVEGEVEPEALKPIVHALNDDRAGAAAGESECEQQHTGHEPPALRHQRLAPGVSGLFVWVGRLHHRGHAPRALGTGDVGRSARGAVALSGRRRAVVNPPLLRTRCSSATG